MSFSSWLRYWNRSLERRSALHQTHRRKSATGRLKRRLRLEVLEDRILLSGFTEFPVPTPGSFPAGLTVGADGNLWFTQEGSNQIGHITTAGTVTEFPVPGNQQPWGLATGPDGNVWFGTNQPSVGRITPAGVSTLFPVLSGGDPDVATGPDGNLWVTEAQSNQIAVVSPQGVLLNQYSIPVSGGTPEYITAGPDGNMWFTEIQQIGSQTFYGPLGAAYVGRVSTNGSFTMFAIPGTPNNVKAITAGPDGNIWFDEQYANKIGRLTPSGVLTEFAIPTPNSVPNGFTVGPDGNLWFVEAAGNQIARITPAGVITEFPIPTPNSGPLEIRTGADGNLWFTESNANQIGRFKLPGPQLTVNNLAVSGSNGAVVGNSGTYSDGFPGATVTLTASAGTVVQNSNGTWSWSETTPAGAAQAAPVTIYAKDSNNQTAAVEFWLNVGQVFTVTNTGDNGGVNPAPGAGTGILRQAIIDADNASTSGGPSLIAFAIPTSDPGYNPTTGAFTITPQGGLSNFTISAPVVLDGYTQPGAIPNTLAIGDNAALKIQIDMSQFSAGGYGFILHGDDSTVRGLVLNDVNAGSWAVSLAGTGDQASRNFIGTDVTGTSVVGGATQLASGGGIDIPWYSAPSPGDIIGGTTPDARNIISGFGTGVSMANGAVGQGNNIGVLEGNFIGTDASGTKVLGNQLGVSATGTIGGTASGAGNLISGNATGIGVGAGAGPCQIQGNLIGTDVTGTSALANRVGISLDSDFPLTIGGATSGARNIVSGNSIGIEDVANVPGVLIEGNYIGTDITGTKSVVGDGDGIWLQSGQTVGGTSPGDGNVISGNGFGVRLFGSNNVVQGNLIGTDYTGTKPLGNGIGIFAFGAGNDNLIGGLDTNASGSPLAGGGNIISGNSDGIDLSGGNTGIEGNYIGTNISGMKAIGNFRYGVLLANGASGNTIGGTTAAARNLISANGDTGIIMTDESGGTGLNLPSNNVVEGNYIGTDATGSVALGNGTGVSTGGVGNNDGVENNLIGGTAPGAGNLISGNKKDGIDLLSLGNQVQGNLIGTDATGTRPLGNADTGIYVNGGGNQIGGTSAEAGNVVSSNSTGVAVFGVNTNLIQGNSIVGNLGAGVDLDFSAFDNTVGGTAAGAGNTIASNGGDGVYIGSLIGGGDTWEAYGNAILSNSIHNNGNLGIHLASGANENQAAPVLTSTNSSSNGTTISGSLTSGANTTFRIEFFSNPSPNPSGYGEGLTFLGFANVTTDANGHASFTATSLAPVPAGQGWISATATNANGNTSQFSRDLEYNFSGFLPPLGQLNSYSINRNIPIKFQLTDVFGNAVTSLGAVTALQIFNSQSVDILGGNGAAGLSVSSGTYSYGWSTKGLPAGPYTISVTLADGSTHTIPIQLASNGKSANAQAADGSDVGDGITAGQLLGGNVELYVDNSNSNLTPDELARIQDAVNAVDATIAPYGVAITETTDPTQADVTLNIGTNSAVGGYAQGILGCYTTAGTITLIQGWNWYAGSDPTLIGANQYDFQTTVTHELGHALGLGESSNPTSAMYGTLTPGTTIRTLTTADLNIPYDEGSADAQRAAVPQVAPLAGVGIGNSTANTPSMSAPNSTTTPSSSSLSGGDPIFADLGGFLSDLTTAYQSELSSVSALWQTVDALALQNLDALLSMEAGAMGVSKDTLMRDFLFASNSAPNGM